MRFSYTATATVILDIIACFLLLGLMQCTKIYRERGKLLDRIFFAMLISDMLMAGFDIAVEVFNNEKEVFYHIVTILCASVMTLVFELLGFLIAQYLCCLLPQGEDIVKKNFKVFSIPLVASAAMVVLNLFSGFLFRVDPSTGQYMHGPAYNLIFIPTLIYAVIGVFVLWKVNRLGIILFLMLLISRIVMEILFTSVSSTPLILSVVLIYMLVANMNRAFHGEETDAGNN